MKICVFQPKYPCTIAESYEYSNFLLNSLDQCDENFDLILLPEVCNAPGTYQSIKELQNDIEKNTNPLIKKVRETAIRCGALVAVNLYDGQDGLYRNTTMLFAQDGKIKGKYLKQHLPPGEIKLQIDDSYSYIYDKPYSIEVDGIKYGFLTCYDVYFNEYIAQIATLNLDIILIPSYQRAERTDIIEMEAKNIAFNCNAYVIRSSVSMGDDTHLYGGNSMVVAPDGRVLENFGQKTGKLVCTITPHIKYERSNGFGSLNIRNDKFIDQGRKPWNYRACGPSVIPGDNKLPYPRVCSHRGFNTIAPENTMAAFRSAVALGADELEMDIWPTKDHRLVVCHDDTVDRTSNGSGRIIDLTWEEIKRFNIGEKYAPQYDGLKYPLFEEILQCFARQVIINLHIKSIGHVEEYDHDNFRNIVELIYKYDCQEHVYIAGEEDVLRTAEKLTPQIPRCVIDGKQDFNLVKLAKKYGCKKIQLYSNRILEQDYFTQEMIDEAKSAGIRCNMFWTDNPAEVIGFLKRGIDTILTNDFLRVANVIWGYREEGR